MNTNMKKKCMHKTMNKNRNYKKGKTKKEQNKMTQK